jgi:hypothetical protein
MSEDTTEAPERGLEEGPEMDSEDSERTENEQNAAPGAESDERPPIEEGEMADLDLEVDPEEVEEEAGADTPDTADEAIDGAQDAIDDAGDGHENYGVMYVEGISTVVTAVKKEKGSGGTANKQQAYNIGLDKNFDRWIKERGVGPNMPPGQAVMLGTMIYLLFEVSTDDELLQSAMEEAI